MQRCLLLSRRYSQFSVSGGQIVRSTPSAIRTGYLSACLSRYYSSTQIHFRVHRKADSGLLKSSKSFPVPLDASRGEITEELIIADSMARRWFGLMWAGGRFRLADLRHDPRHMINFPTSYTVSLGFVPRWKNLRMS